MTSPTEQADLDVLHKKQHDIRENAFDHMRHILRMDAKELGYSGHKTTADAIVYTVKSTLTDLDKVVKAHLVKWPD